MRRILILGSASILVEALKHVPDVEVTTLEPGMTGKDPDRAVLDEIHEHVLKMAQPVADPVPTFTKRNDIDRSYGKKYRRSLRR